MRRHLQELRPGDRRRRDHDIGRGRCIAQQAKARFLIGSVAELEREEKASRFESHAGARCLQGDDVIGREKESGDRLARACRTSGTQSLARSRSSGKAGPWTEAPSARTAASRTWPSRERVAAIRSADDGSDAGWLAPLPSQRDNQVTS